MGFYRSLAGKTVGYNQNGLLFNGRPVGQQPAALGRGKTVYVDSAIDASSGTSPDEAVGTLDEAFALCVENRGDTIVVLPNHAETVTGVAGIAHDKAGVSVIGLGTGNQRPRFLMDGGTTVTYVVSAADAYIENLVFASGHLLVAAGIEVTTGVHCWINGCEWYDNTTAENWGTPVKATGAANTADGLRVTNCRWVPLPASVNELEFIELTDDIHGMVIANNFIAHEGTVSPLVLQAGSKIMTAAQITGNFISTKMTTGDLLVDNGGATNSGIFAYNNVGHAVVGGAHAMGAATGMRFFENRSVSTAVLSGLLLPAADIDS